MGKFFTYAARWRLVVRLRGGLQSKDRLLWWQTYGWCAATITITTTIGIIQEQHRPVTTRPEACIWHVAVLRAVLRGLKSEGYGSEMLQSSRLSSVCLLTCMKPIADAERLRAFRTRRVIARVQWSTYMVHVGEKGMESRDEVPVQYGIASQQATARSRGFGGRTDLQPRFEFHSDLTSSTRMSLPSLHFCCYPRPCPQIAFELATDPNLYPLNPGSYAVLCAMTWLSNGLTHQGLKSQQVWMVSVIQKF